MSTRLRIPVQAFEDTPYWKTLGIEVTAVSPDRVRLQLPYRDDNSNRNGSIHGGVLASLVDIAGALATSTGSDDDNELERNTVDLAVHYLAPAVREDLTADATVLRRGREIVFVDVGVASDAGQQIARGLVAQRVCRRAAANASDSQGSTTLEIPEHLLVSIKSSGSPFSARLGVAVAQLGDGGAAAVLPHRAELTDRDGRVHEGALAGLIDCVGGAAAWSNHGFDARARASTIGMHVSYAVTTRDEDVVAVATTPWRTAGIFVVPVSLAGRASGRPVATGSVTYRIARAE